MEKNITIQTSDDHLIYGTLNARKEKTQKLIIFVHGFTGHANEHFLYSASRFFPQHGFDTFRFNLYWFEDKARSLNTATVGEHISDFRTVYEYFKKEYTEIYAVGHSLGAQIIVRVHIPELKAISLWEPSVEVSQMCKNMKYVPALDVYIETSYVDMVVGKNFVEQAKTFPILSSILPTVTTPTQVIGAALAGEDTAQAYFDQLTCKKEIHTIQGSGHTFDEGTAVQELLNRTLGWFKKY